jgi:acyl carrier protein
MVPQQFVLLEELPLTSNGKLDRAALPCPVPGTGRGVLQQFYVAPETEAQQALARIWADVLHVERVGIHDNFFDLGGHSLLGMQVIARVRDLYEVNLPLRSIFEQGTVAQLAEILQNALFEKVASLSEEEAQRLLGGPELFSRGA